MRPDMHAAAAAEAVRALNHATLIPGSADGYASPADVDAVLAELSLLAQRLPQALEQTASWLDRNAAAGRIGHDKGYDGDHAAVLAAVLIRAGGTAAETMLRRLDEARQITSHLTGLPTPQAISAGPGESR